MELFILAIIASIVFFISLIVTLWGELNDKVPGILWTVISFIVTIVLFIASLIVQVPTGHVGVKTVFSKVIENEHLTEGLNFVLPWVDVNKMSVRTHSLSLSGNNAIQVLSSDGLKIDLDITVNYRLMGPDAPWVYQNLGTRYQESIVIPAVRTAVREASAQFTFQQLYSESRDEAAELMAKSVRKTIQVILDEYGRKGGVVTVQQVLIRNVGLPDKIKESIEQKLQAEQEAQRMVFVLEKEKQEADRKRIEAKGIKDFQDIVRQGIDEQLLRWKGIEATQELAKSTNSKVVIFGSSDTGGLPIILNTKDSK